jgi:hypothetical protein
MKGDTIMSMIRRSQGRGMVAVAGAAAAIMVGALAAAQPSAPKPSAPKPSAPQRIGYVMTDEHWALYETPGAKQECPKGFNLGPREQFKVLFPDNGKKRSVVDTQLAREAAVWFPSTAKESFEFLEAQGPIALGVNLDGKVGPSDFTSPDGEKGIDNQLYRVIGCVRNYRREGELGIITTKWRQQESFNRLVIELTGVDNLDNDDEVQVTLYRGIGDVMMNALGTEYLPGGTQRIDSRWGKRYIHTWRGSIKNGLLTTDAVDAWIPEMGAFSDTSQLFFHGMRFQLKLTPTKAVGFVAGYADVDVWYYALNTAWATHHQSYGQSSAPSIYRALRRLADGYPDPKTGQNQGISAALDVAFTQVYIDHQPSGAELFTQTARK